MTARHRSPSMDKDWLFAIMVLLIIAGYIQAYNWGWHAGHDVHHSDDMHRPDPTNAPPPPPTLWK